MDKRLKTQTLAIDTPFDRRDPYGAISMPVYHTVAYEFDTAAEMTEAFTGRVLAPDYSRVMNPTVTYLENKVKAITEADHLQHTARHLRGWQECGDKPPSVWQQLCPA